MLYRDSVSFEKSDFDCKDKENILLKLIEREEELSMYVKHKMRW